LDIMAISQSRNGFVHCLLMRKRSLVSISGQPASAIHVRYFASGASVS
jgi:hypothetical protein